MKTYKGWELIRDIAEGKIKERTRFKAGYKTFIARDGYLFEEYDKKDDRYATSFEMMWDFELIEEQQDIDIQEIEEICIRPYQGFTATCEYIEEKGNEIIEALKQLDRKMKE